MVIIQSLGSPLKTGDKLYFDARIPSIVVRNKPALFDRPLYLRGLDRFKEALVVKMFARTLVIVNCGDSIYYRLFSDSQTALYLYGVRVDMRESDETHPETLEDYYRVLFLWLLKFHPGSLGHFAHPKDLSSIFSLDNGKFSFLYGKGERAQHVELWVIPPTSEVMITLDSKQISLKLDGTYPKKLRHQLNKFYRKNSYGTHNSQ